MHKSPFEREATPFSISMLPFRSTLKRNCKPSNGFEPWQNRRRLLFRNCPALERPSSRSTWSTGWVGRKAAWSNPTSTGSSRTGQPRPAGWWRPAAWSRIEFRSPEKVVILHALRKRTLFGRRRRRRFSDSSLRRHDFAIKFILSPFIMINASQTCNSNTISLWRRRSQDWGASFLSIVALLTSSSKVSDEEKKCNEKNVHFQANWYKALFQAQRIVRLVVYFHLWEWISGKYVHELKI